MIRRKDKIGLPGRRFLAELVDDGRDLLSVLLFFRLVILISVWSFVCYDVLNCDVVAVVAVVVVDIAAVIVDDDVGVVDVDVVVVVDDGAVFVVTLDRVELK